MGTEGGKYIFKTRYPGLGMRKTLAQPAQLLTSCVCLAKLTNFFKPQITHVQKRYKNTFPMWLFQKAPGTGPGT